MATNVISLEVTQEQATEVDRLLKEIETRLGPLVDLTFAARKHLAKMGRRNVDFVDRGYRHAEINREYLTGKIPYEEFKKDVDLAGWLRIVEKKLALIFNKVKDTAILAEAEAYRAARLYYNAARAAARAGDEVAEQIARDMSIHYRKKRSPNEEIPPPETPQQ